jgi:hypothetical protein
MRWQKITFETLSRLYTPDCVEEIKKISKKNSRMIAVDVDSQEYLQFIEKCKSKNPFRDKEEFPFRMLEATYLPDCVEKIKRLGVIEGESVKDVDTTSEEFRKIDRECRKVAGEGARASQNPSAAGSTSPDMIERAIELARRLSICQPCEDFLGIKSAGTVKCDRVTAECHCKNLVTEMCVEWEE